MARAPRIVDTLKQQLRQRSISYRQLADELELSESAIKQMFASGNMSLKRLDAVCHVLGLEISDLAGLAESGEDKLVELSREQEGELVSEVKFLLVAYCVVNHWTFEDITGYFEVEDTECIQYLARLDRMKLIELLPGNRIKPLIATNFKWQINGPIEQFFRTEVQSKFFASSFNSDGSMRVVKNGYLTHEGQAQLTERMKTLGEHFDESLWDARKQPVDKKFGVTMVLAIRQWQFGAFEQFARTDADDS